LGFAYYLRIAIRIFTAPKAETPRATVNLSDALAMAVCVAVIVILGVYPEPLTGLAAAAFR
jgi:NADH:ubiquinone oxidoreductase subunit 2 (subunit N)